MAQGAGAMVLRLFVTLLLLLPGWANAAACCMSATSFGVGRLLAWEDFAVGVQLGHTRLVGQYDPERRLRLSGAQFQDGISRVEPWGIVRLSERVQLQARVPVFFNDREAGGVSQLAGGLGDVGAGVRFEVISLGEFERVPSFGVTVGALAPTGRRAEQAFAPLGAGATGRGVWGASVAIESEYTWLPWYVRLDAGLTLTAPFRRTDTQATQWFGPLVQAALSGGRELVADKLVLALSTQLEWEAPLSVDGVIVPTSSGFVPSLVASLSWRVQPHLTLVTSVSTTVWPQGLAQNRDARLGASLGVRYGHF
jgi:hypothetical protein